MFDPTSLTMIVVFSLCIMPAFTFAAYVFLFRHFKDFPAACRRLTRRKTRVLLSLLSGVQMTPLFYLVSLVMLWEYASVVSLSGIIVRVLIFAVLCGIGTYIGATAASWIFGSKVPLDLSGGSS